MPEKEEPKVVDKRTSQQPDVEPEPMEPTGRDIVMVGSASSTRHYIKEASKNPNTEFWGMNNHWDLMPKPRAGKDRWYANHPKAENDASKVTPFIEADHGVEIFTMPDSLIPGKDNVKVYPLEEIVKRFDLKDDRTLLTSQVALMMAHALYEHMYEGRKIAKVSLFGFDMASMSEQGYQRPGGTHWLGRLMEHMEVFVPPESKLLEGNIYSYEPVLADDRADNSWVDEYVNHFNFELRGYIDFVRGQAVRQFIETYMIRGGIQFQPMSTPQSGTHPSKVKQLIADNEYLEQALEQDRVTKALLIEAIEKVKTGELDINNVRIEVPSNNGAVPVA